MKDLCNPVALESTLLTQYSNVGKNWAHNIKTDTVVFIPTEFVEKLVCDLIGIFSPLYIDSCDRGVGPVFSELHDKLAIICYDYLVKLNCCTHIVFHAVIVKPGQVILLIPLHTKYFWLHCL